MTTLQAEEIVGNDPVLAQALIDAGLPIDDLGDPGRRFFRFCDPGGQVVGFIGWESRGRCALVRSLVVLPAQRGLGWSRHMMKWALAQLAESGVADAYILATDAVPLSRRFGFSPIDRSQAPPTIRDSRQFESLCPATAVLLHRCLP